MHILCTICSDLVNQAENTYATKCGHIFHYHCLSQWIERSKSCPQCRNKVTERCMFRLYPTVSNETTQDDAATLQSRLDDVQLQLRQQKQACTTLEGDVQSLTDNLKKNENTIKSLEQKLVTKVSAVQALNEQIMYLKIENNQANKLKEENETLKKNLQTLNGLQIVLNAVADEVENMLKGYADVKTIATFATALKRALCESESKKTELRNRLHSAKQQVATEKQKYSELFAKMVELEDKLANAEKKYESLEKANKKRQANEIEVSYEKSDKKREANKMEVANTDPLLNPKKARHTEMMDLNTALIADTSNNSLNSMVNRIENADSPYLTLKQSSLALTALNRAPLNIPAEKIKPTDYAILSKVKLPTKENKNSIFYKKDPIKIICSQAPEEFDTATYDISYDGLGGHSKLDIFPTPKLNLKKGVPKLTAKHKLKRPVASGSQDIGIFFDSICKKQ